MFQWFYRYFIAPFAVDKPKAVEPLKQKSMQLITPEKFAELTGIVIDNFEGGYYHPDMLKNFKPTDQAKLKASGETMFGLDRKAGAQLATYGAWGDFWKEIDSDRASNPAVWKYQYKGGMLASKLKELCASIMFQWYGYLAKKYLNDNLTAAIANDDRLIIHFVYSCWNGEGFFKKFGTALYKAIDNHPGDKNGIFQEAIKARTESSNKVIRQQGVNMLALFHRLHL